MLLLLKVASQLLFAAAFVVFSSLLLKVNVKPKAGCCFCSFASTERYLVLALAPCVISPMKMLINKNFFQDVQWKPQNGVKFYVVDKDKEGPGHVATFRLAVKTVPCVALFYCICSCSSDKSGLHEG